MPIEAVVLIWWAAGSTGAIYWWTTEHDLTVGNLLLVVLVGMFGPLSWLMGWLEHGGGSKLVLMRRRRPGRSR